MPGKPIDCGIARAGSEGAERHRPRPESGDGREPEGVETETPEISGAAEKPSPAAHRKTEASPIE
jgi:hypothetical protein